MQVDAKVGKVGNNEGRAMAVSHAIVLPTIE